jgi:Ca2+-binding RTX toxin-like protein
MSGGAGSDTYVVDNEFDGVGEAEGGGIDTVISSVTLRLSEHVEFLTLTGTANLTGIGNAADNSISGNGGANILVGEEGNDTITGGGGNDTLDGSQGNDVLNGGAGNDLLNGRDGIDFFIFDAPLSATLNVDTVDDFDPSQDLIYLSKSVFTGLGDTSQALQAGQFSSGAGINAASAPSHRIIYNTTTGDLYYDRDGSALAAAPIKFAVINGSPDTLDNTDFFVTT